MTIASSMESEEKLEQVEAGHFCPEKALSELLVHRAPAEPHVDTR